MKRTKVWFLVGLTSLLTVLLLFSAVPQTAEAGVYDESSDTVYREYWVPHTQFRGHCNQENAGKWFIEVQRFGATNEGIEEPCPGYADVVVNIPDSLASAEKVEIYLDLWRNYDDPSARFTINGGDEYQPNVGSDWSRTPYIGEVDASDFNVGNNTIRFQLTGGRVYHIHDIAIRAYFDEATGPGNYSPPDGQLASITHDDGTVNNPYIGNQTPLMVNSNQLTLSATVDDANVDIVEFIAYYEGYDEDSDGDFTDWHNRTRNNWHPGGNTTEYNNNPAPDANGTIDHIGSLAVDGAGTYQVTWDLAHVPNQSDVRFKVRLLDRNGQIQDVRDAAGGQSRPFRLLRDRATAVYMIPNFEDNVLHHDLDEDGDPAPAPGFFDEHDYTITLPDPADYQTAYMVGAYWQNPLVQFNGDASSEFGVFGPFAGSDDWLLAINEVDLSDLQEGENTITYLFNDSNTFGQFIEKPGPMFVFHGPTINDVTPPVITPAGPVNNDTDVDTKTDIVVNLTDAGVGVDKSQIDFTIEGESFGPDTVSPVVTGFSNSYVATYNPSLDLPNSETVTVTVSACDLDSPRNCANLLYTFETEEQDTTPPTISNVEAVTQYNSAVISWDTDELATSVVRYGTASNSLDQTVSLTDLVSEHMVQLPDLDPETTYFYRVQSEDDDGNLRSFPGGGDTNSFTTQSFNALISDDFNYCTDGDLSALGWTFSDPLGEASYTLDGQELTISVPAGLDYDVFTNGNPINRAARMMQPSNNADGIEVRFSSLVTEEIQQQGLIVEEDADNFLRANFQYQNGELLVMVILFEDGSVTMNQSEAFVPDDPNGPLYMSVEQHSGTTWRAYFSTGPGTITEWIAFQFDLDVTAVGVYAGSTDVSNVANAPGHTAVVDYFFNTASPIEPEDDTATFLSVLTQNENGLTAANSVTKSAECGNPVELTTVPVAGWQFDQWLGAPLEGSADETNPTPTVNYDFDDEVTAVFSRIPYAVNITIDNAYSDLDETPNEAGGTVTGGDSEPYYIGDEVELTAEANPGWTFAGWSGDVPNGQANNASITLDMDSDKDVTATFTQNEYEITIGIDPQSDGIGTVNGAISGDYIYGDTFTLTATPAAGNNYFVGWSGTLLPTSENPLEYTVTSDETIFARFTNNRPPTVQVSTDDALMAIPLQNIEIVVTGVDTEDLTLSADNMPPGATFVDNGNKTGTFRWTPGPGQQGMYQIVFNVTDANNTVPYQVEITVEGNVVLMPLIIKHTP